MPDHDEPLPDPALVVLVGASGSGKSTWAKSRYRSTEIVSSDELRAVVGSGRHDLDASTDAFALLDLIVADESGADSPPWWTPSASEPLAVAATWSWRRASACTPVVVAFDAPAELCRHRNARRDRPVPGSSPTNSGPTSRSWASWATRNGCRHSCTSAPPNCGGSRLNQRRHTNRSPTPAWTSGCRSPASPGARTLRVGCARSRWPPKEAGFAGIALMGHLIQMPNVGKAWGPTREPWVTLGMLAGLNIAARLGDSCNVPSDLETLDRKSAVLREHCAEVGRDPEDVALTVLDLPVVGSDRDKVGDKVERPRGRTASSTYAKRHHAGMTRDHRDRYAQLSERDVSTVFVALPDLAGPADLSAMAPALGHR